MSKILICTGIYPPKIGGPAQYAKAIKEELEKRGNTVMVRTYTIESHLPSVARHLFFFWKVFLSSWKADFIIALDTFSVGWPAAMAAKFLNKKIIIRTGGDFLWESYVERTGDMVLFKDFYNRSKGNFNLKEKVVFEVIKWTLQNVSAIAFSTQWQKEIFENAYSLDRSKNFIVENYFGEKFQSADPEEKLFISGGRPIKLKNNARLVEAFQKAQEIDPLIRLSVENIPHEQFIEKLKKCYAVILTSISDISPNMILEAVRYNRPFITTRETGVYEKLKDIGLFVDPKNPDDIKEKILFLANENNYKVQKQKVSSFGFLHSWTQITEEILAIVKSIS